MLKDKKLIRKVINERTRIKMKAMQKLYRLLKSAVRDWEDEMDRMKSKPLKSFIIDQLREYFKLIDKVNFLYHYLN